MPPPRQPTGRRYSQAHTPARAQSLLLPGLTGGIVESLARRAPAADRLPPRPQQSYEIKRR